MCREIFFRANSRYVYFYFPLHDLTNSEGVIPYSALKFSEKRFGELKPTAYAISDTCFCERSSNWWARFRRMERIKSCGPMPTMLIIFL